jgi:hypothetical protein
MKSDSDIKRDVEAELRWTPDVDDIDNCVSREARHARRILPTFTWRRS